MFYERNTVIVIALVLMGVPLLTTAETAWTLESAIRRGLEVAPELRAAEAEINARIGGLQQAGAWPNPSIDLRADQKLGIEDGSGGGNLTQISVTQPLPLARLAYQRLQAEKQLAATRERARHVRLMRETEVARAFHALQLTQARLALAEQRVAFVADLESETARRSDRVVRYLTPLERARLAILREAAEQETISAEGKHSETVSLFRTLLALTPSTTPQTAPLIPAAPPPSLEILLQRLDAHPALVADNQDIEAAHAGVDVARASRFADPTISVFRERDFLNGAQRDYNGVMLSVQIPLWNLNSGGVTRAQAETDQARERHVTQRRDLEARLRQSQLHLDHLIEQAERYRIHLLAPARQMLELARRGFKTGEQNVLALVDGYNTYFDAEVRYYELLQEGWQETAELRLATGVALVPSEVTP